MVKAIKRVDILAEQSPEDRLIAILGDDFSAYRAKWQAAESGVRPSTPLQLDIDLTTACNLRCPMCPAGASGHNFPRFKKNQFMEKKLYEKALTEAAQWRLPALRLGMTGEPLLVKDIAHWVHLAKEAGILDISLISNGQLLTPEISDQLIKAGLTRLMISIDASSAATYAKSRPGGNWPKLLNNIDAFLELRKQNKHSLPLLRLSFIEMSFNCQEKNSFKQLFADKADYISFQRYQNILGGTETSFSCQHLETEQAFCTEPFTRMAIHADGGIFPCCSDFGRLKPIGNIASHSIKDLWQSPEACFYSAPDAKYSEPCRLCLAASESA